MKHFQARRCFIVPRVVEALCPVSVMEFNAVRIQHRAKALREWRHCRNTDSLLGN